MQEQHSPITTVATPTDPQGTYVTYNYGTDADAGWSKLLTSITTTEVDENNNQTTSTQTIDYDAIGNPTSYLGANMTWFARQLKTYSKSGTTVSYTYDANGLRATKTVNGTKSTYVYVNGLLTYEKRGDIEIYFWYDSYGHLMALRCFGLQNNNSYYYVLTNLQGDVLGIYDPAGELVASYEYDTWGNVISMTDTSGVNIGTINPIRYRGYYYDTETGLHYLQSRYYDPQVGRFINADGVTDGGAGIKGNNLYIYSANNPIGYSDPSGHSIISDLVERTKTCIKIATYNIYKNKLKPSLTAMKIALSKLGDRTYVVGVGGSAVALFGASLSCGFAFDNKGNVGKVTSSGVLFGTPSASAGIFSSITNAPSVQDLHDVSYNIGGSCGIGGPFYIGGEFAFPQNMVTSIDECWSGTVSAGIGVPIPIEFHGGITSTSVSDICNIYEKIDKMYITIMTW